MYIAVNETHIGSRGILSVLPQQLRRYMCNIDLDGASELRLIAGKPLAVRYPDGDRYVTAHSTLTKTAALGAPVTRPQLCEMLERITGSSLYSVKDEIRNGYITIEGGHRIGLAGTAVTENGSVEFIRDISAMNVRIANEVIGAADEAAKSIITPTEIKSALFVSPPGAGKTTMLRDMVRQLSYSGCAVSVADERCEIAAMHSGRSAFDLGPLTTVIDNCPKERAMLMLLRSMSPDVIVTDEIGTRGDADAVTSIMNSGVAVIASAHGSSIKQLRRRAELAAVIDMFDLVILLSRRNGAGTIEEIIENA